MAAEAAVSIAVETLGKLLIEKAVLLKGVKGEVEWVREELRNMQCFLKDAAKKQSQSESIRKWISDVREVAHDAEDAIEIFSIKVQSKSLMERYGGFPNHLYHLNKVGNKIKSVRQTLKDIQDRRVRYDIQKDGDNQREEIERRRRVDHEKPEQQVVGLDEDVNKLLGKAVFKESKGRSVAAILGMGGIGKSTLASKIYNHPDVVGGFEFRTWVVFSSEFNPEDILKQILLQLGISDDDLKGLDYIKSNLAREDDLKTKLQKRLTGKRYFIVLDDVWEARHWESLNRAFPDGDKGSRLLLTSRNPVITMNSGYVHNMKVLDEDQSWELFMRKACGGNSSIDRCPNDMKKVGEEILKKCGGLPLAISVVGGILAKKTSSKTEWEKVLKEIMSEVDRSSGDLNTITAILELSYQNLPLELKACFLSLGLFKEDTIIKVKELVHIWVAQGLVVQEVEREEVARDYLNELISRNMVQVKEMEFDEVKACQIHDLLRNLSISKAKEEIDFEVLREKQNSHQSLAKPRHRAIYCSETSFVYSTNRNQRLRSLFIHYYTDWYISGGPSYYWKSFELLRILHLGNDVYFRVLPKGIGLLTGLKYLKLKMRYMRGVVTRLPRSWTHLKNLEILDIRGDRGGIEIDKVILKMESLRHLYVNVTSSKVGLGNMRKLQTLHKFQVKSSSELLKIQGMSSVSKLGLDVFDIGETNSLFRCLSSLENLFHLTISQSSPSTDLKGLTSLHRVTRLKLHIRSFISAALPVYFPPNLSYLTLRLIWWKEDSMAVLKKLPNLLYLKLQDVIIRDGIMAITSGGFPTLKVFHIKNIEYARKMEIQESAMPELNQFIIRNCPNFDAENLPERIKSAIIVEAR